MSSLACENPWGWGTNSVSPRGGSPRSAMMFSTPASSYSSSNAAISSRLCPTQVRWAMASMPASRLILRVMATVFSRVLPPAP